MKAAIQSQNAPAPIGPYTQAIKVGQQLYISGQIGLCPKSQQIVAEDCQKQTEQVFKNLAAVLDAAGGKLADIVKLSIYLIDFADFPVINKVMEQIFGQPYPARATVQVSRLPKDARVEVEAIAYLVHDG